VVAVVDSALAKQSITTKAVERWKSEMPTEQEMLPRDKYTIFDRKEKKYRKGIHSMCPWERLEMEECANGLVELPKWTRLSQRLNPPGY